MDIEKLLSHNPSVNLLPCKQVNKLKRGHRYKFRVFAENEYGSSEPATTEESSKISDVPGAPGRPQVKHQTATSVRLEWTGPTNDGGSSIEGLLNVLILTDK